MEDTTRRRRRRRRRSPESESTPLAAKETAREHEGDSTFASLGLSERSLAAVADMGFLEPTPVQARVIPAVLAGRDVLAEAETGSGKTCAFVLPTLDGLSAHEAGALPRVLVVTPTRELAAQIAEVAQAECAHTGHVVGVVVGGVGYEGQRAALADGLDMLVATPGRLVDLIGEGTADLGAVETLVIDEADRMLDMGFLPQMRTIVEAAGGSRQTLLFSATLSQGVLDRMGDVVRDPVRVEIAPKGLAADNVDQYVLGVSSEAKKRVLVEVLRREGPERVICFCRGKHRADHLSRVLNKKGLVAAPIHGNRTQNQRMRALERFRAGEVDVLVATDVLARGIDVAEVAYVVNVDVPHEPQDYVHRIGRTGRGGKSGFALTFVSEDETRDLLAIERLMGRAIDAYAAGEDLDVGEKPARLEEARALAAGDSGRGSRASGHDASTQASAPKAASALGGAGANGANGANGARRRRRRRAGRRGGAARAASGAPAGAGK